MWHNHIYVLYRAFLNLLQPELTYVQLFTALGILNVLYLTCGKFRFINDPTKRFPKVYNSSNVTCNASNYNS